MTKFSFRWGLPELDNRDGTFIPGFILKGYTHLNVTRDEFLCIVHLSAYHYDSPKGKANPSLTTIAREMGYAHKNSVWRMIQSLRAKDMLIVEHNEGMTSTYNMRPFALACQKLAQATVTLEGDTSTGDTTVTLAGDTPSPSSVTEEVEKDKEIKKKKLGAEKKPRRSTARDIALAALEAEFHNLTNIPLPERETKKQCDAAAVTWWNPLWFIHNLAGQDCDRSKALMGQAIARMRKDKLTIASPKSIQNVATAIFAEGNGNGHQPNQPTSQPTNQWTIEDLARRVNQRNAERAAQATAGTKRDP